MHFIPKWQFISMVCLMSCAQNFAQTTPTNYNYELRSTLSFPDQTLANVCGWTAPNGSEYALVGASKGMVIVDVTNPAAPVQIMQIPGPDNFWKEIKTYSHYAYITSEGGGGLQIVDLSGLPDTNLTYHNYQGDHDIVGQLNTIHTLHIDTTKGYAYLHGSNLSSVVVVDLNVDPYNPMYAGKYDQSGYVHDGYVDNDTLYACHVASGYMTMVDMTDKSAPQVFGSVQTPGLVPHNSWLFDDRKHILTTDEAFPSFVTSYDISDPSNIIELDRYSSNDGNSALCHNTHVVKNSFAVTSWYIDGVTTVDISRPSNLVEVGRYDTWPWDAGNKITGCWGAYPYFPSGTIIASNIDPGQLFIFSPTYTRACYVEGTVLDGCTQQPLVGAKIEILGGSMQATDYSRFGGAVKTGQVTPGTFMLRLSKAGYTAQEFEATLVAGAVFNFTKILEPVAAFSLTGTVTDDAGNVLANAQVVLTHGIQTYLLQTNANGVFNQNCLLGGQYGVLAGQWGYFQTDQININSTTNIDLPIVLQPGYYDNFSTDNGWVSSGTASSGVWERGEPQGTVYNGEQSNPEFDLTTDLGNQCYVTGNSNSGTVSMDDVDNGNVILTSPKMNLLGFEDAKLSFSYWFFNNGGQGTLPNDHFEVRITDGVNTAVVFTTNASLNAWRSSGDIFLGQYMALNDDIRIQFVTTDDNPDHVVESAVDVFSVTPTLVGTIQPEALTKMQIQPNPSHTDFVLQYNWADADQQPVLEIHNLIGQSVASQLLLEKSGSAHFGADLLPGVYFVTLRSGERQSIPVKVVKQ